MNIYLFVFLSEIKSGSLDLGIFFLLKFQMRNREHMKGNWGRDTLPHVYTTLVLTTEVARTTFIRLSPRIISLGGSPVPLACALCRRLLGRRRPTRRRPGFHLRRRRAPTRCAHPSSSSPAVRNRALKPKLYVSGSEIWSNYKCSRHLLRLETSNFFEKICRGGSAPAAPVFD